MWAPDLARQFPGRTEILVYPPVHMATAGLFFKYAGFTAKTADLYTALCALLTSLGCMLAVARLGLQRAALAVAPLGFMIFSFYGLRPEVTGAPLFSIGLALLLGKSRIEALVGRTLLFLAPAAAPTMLGPAGAMLAVFTLDQVWTERRIAPIFDSVVALLIAVLIFGLPVGFRYEQVVADTAYHYAAQGSNVYASAFIKAGLLLAGALLVWKRDAANKPAALALLGLAVAVLILTSRSHTGASFLVNYLGAAIFISALFAKTAWEKLGAFVVLGVALLIFSHLVVFWVTTKADPQSDARTREAVQSLRNEGRTLLVDDIAAKYLYDFDIDDKIGWHWARPFPDTVPTSLAELRKDDLWVVSRFAFLGYLDRETAPFVKYLNLAKEPYGRARLLPCLIGRMSCRLPARRFDYVLFWRDKSGQAYVQDLIADPEPRPIS